MYGEGEPDSVRPDLILLGVGDVARGVARLASQDHEVYGSTRSEQGFSSIASTGITPFRLDLVESDELSVRIRDAFVLVSFPPDGHTDSRLAPHVRGARSIVYISSTGVYGSRRGRIDDNTTVAEDDPRARQRLAAEQAWRSVGAIVLRSPGQYGVYRGLHIRLRQGTYRIPGDGTNVVSRIHLDDLAQIVMAALYRGRRGETYVVGDLCPVPQIQVVEWLCSRLGIAVPESLALDEVHPTLRGSRAVDPGRALEDLQVTLRYPTYKEGFDACLCAHGSDEHDA